jgi:outer membrane protein
VTSPSTPRILVCVTCLLAVAAAQARAETKLTADDVARRAQATSYEVRARADERAAAESAVDQTMAAYLPRLSGAARYTRLSDVKATSLGMLVVAPGAQPGSTPDPSRMVAVPLEFPTIPNQVAAQASLQVPLSDYLLRIPQAHAAASGNARSAALTEKAARLRTGTEARVAYYLWLRARMQVHIAEQAVEQAHGHLEDVKHAAEAETASTADVLRVESQVATAELLLTRVRNLVVVSETQLRTLMHDPSTEPYASTEDLLAPLEDAPETAAAELLWSEAASQRLELRALDESAGAYRQQAKVALASGLPRLDAIGNAAYANPNPRIFPQDDHFRGTWDASVQLAWAPTDLPAAQAARRAAKARAAQLDDQRAALLDGIKLEVTQSAQALAEARAAIETARRGQRAAEESCRIRRVLFQNGRATSVELTDAETELTRARMELVGAQIDLRVAHARLVHALGRDSMVVKKAG